MSRVEWSSSRYIQQRRKEQSAVAQNQNGLKQNRRIEQNNRIKWAQTEQTELNITEYSRMKQNKQQNKKNKAEWGRAEQTEQRRTEQNIEQKRTELMSRVE